MATLGGLAVDVGGVAVSATDPSRLCLEGAVLLVVAEVLAGASSRWRIPAVLALLLLAGAWDSPTRRIGDGFEYLAMARQLSRARPPSLAAEDFAALDAELRARGDTSWDTAPMPSLRGGDGRYDFPHFWVYSLVAAPFVAAADALHLHPAKAFTALHVLLLLAVTWRLTQLDPAGGAVAVLVSAMLFWWVDKAHAEVFLATTTIGALLLRQAAPAVALLLLGLAAAQMPLLLALLVPAAAVALVSAPTARTVRAVAGAFALPAAYPLYYLWRLGVASPLPATVVPHLPGARAVLTPLIDLNLGVMWFAPLVLVLALVGVCGRYRGARWIDHLPPLIAVAAILVAAAQSPNVNHGGTPGVSRYGIWIAALLTPFALRGAVVISGRWRAALGFGVALSVVLSAAMLHPRFEDAGVRPSSTRLAALVWTTWPGLDNPLPEVFAERVGHVDGPAPIPVATGRCEKALIVGTGGDVRWPPQCVPRGVPAACTPAGALCYANGFSVVPAPSP